MLIINADDWGRSQEATDQSLACFRAGRITSTTVMVFMADSSRGAQLALDSDIDAGLHLNFSEEFTGSGVPESVRAEHNRIRRFLCASKYSLLVFHPGLAGGFRRVLEAQLGEFRRLFSREPTHLDGHQHLHLCSNVVLQGLLPAGAKVRRSFSFRSGEKGFVNRGYRAWVDRRLARRHRLTDGFFALSQHLEIEQFRRVVDLARGSVVELMCHPQVRAESEFLLSEPCAAALGSVRLGGYSRF